jgi:hypothetical protein
MAYAKTGSMPAGQDFRRSVGHEQRPVAGDAQHQRGAGRDLPQANLGGIRRNGGTCGIEIAADQEAVNARHGFGMPALTFDPGG